MVRVTGGLENQQIGIAPYILLKPTAYLFVWNTRFHLSDSKLSGKNLHDTSSDYLEAINESQKNTNKRGVTVFVSSHKDNSFGLQMTISRKETGASFNTSIAILTIWTKGVFITSL